MSYPKKLTRRTGVAGTVTLCDEDGRDVAVVVAGSDVSPCTADELARRWNDAPPRPIGSNVRAMPEKWRGQRDSLSSIDHHKERRTFERCANELQTAIDSDDIAESFAIVAKTDRIVSFTQEGAAKPIVVTRERPCAVKIPGAQVVAVKAIDDGFGWALFVGGVEVKRACLDELETLAVRINEGLGTP